MKRLLLICTMVILGFGLGSHLLSAFSIVLPDRVTRSMLDRQSTIEMTLLRAPFSLMDLGSLSIRLDPTMTKIRGSYMNSGITLSTHIARESEAYAVFLHELGHFVDIRVLRSIFSQADPSKAFYDISWQSRDTKRAGSRLSHFISGYAATNQYEDFAESFVFYILFNQTFSERASRDPILKQKYRFFSDTVFPRGEFQQTDFRIGVVPSYSWDTTKIPFSLKKYLYYLK